MKEFWKDIPGYEGLYKVSNHGRVMSVKFGPKTNSVRLHETSKVLKPSITNVGYLKVQLYKDSHSKIFYIHRLVASVFIPNPENKSQVNHIDCNKQNNRVDNLEWVTPSENQKHAIKNGLRASSPNLGKKGSLNPNSKAVYQCDLNGNIIHKWYGISEAARETGLSSSGISACLRRKNKTCKGFIWKYAEE